MDERLTRGEMTDPNKEFQDLFSNEEIEFGINQYAEIKLGMSGKEFANKVRAGEPVHLLHKKAQEVANLVLLLDKRKAGGNA